IANLDVAPGFRSAAAVLPGHAGPFHGIFPASLVRPDRNNFAPRIGVARKPKKQTVVRTGYGINYNLAQYGTMIQNFAFQPPFANTETNSTDVKGRINGSPHKLLNEFPHPSGNRGTTNFDVNPSYSF